MFFVVAVLDFITFTTIIIITTIPLCWTRGKRTFRSSEEVTIKKTLKENSPMGTLWIFTNIKRGIKTGGCVD